jgi:Spy/CpxP family protein refolding chaperone
LSEKEEKKMKRRMVISIMVLTLVLSGIGGFAGAQTSREGRMTGPGHGMMGFPQASADRPLITFILEHKQELGLTTDQVGSLEAIRSDFQQEAVQRTAEIDSAEAELEGLVKQAPVDLKKVEATVRNIEALRVALRLDRIKAIDRGRSFLNHEQQMRLQALLEQGGRRPWKRRG